MDLPGRSDKDTGFAEKNYQEQTPIAVCNIEYRLELRREEVMRI